MYVHTCRSWMNSHMMWFWEHNLWWRLIFTCGWTIWHYYIINIHTYVIIHAYNRKQFKISNMQCIILTKTIHAQYTLVCISTSTICNSKILHYSMRISSQDKKNICNMICHLRAEYFQIKYKPNGCVTNALY